MNFFSASNLLANESTLNLNSVQTLYQTLVSSELDSFFQMLPISNVSGERSFSKQKMIKKMKREHVCCSNGSATYH